MVKIIKDNSRRELVTCWKCKSILEYSEYDKKLETGCSFDDMYDYIDCPICRERLRIG